MLATPPISTSQLTGSDEIAGGAELVPGAGAIGLSDPLFSAARRKMLDLVNRLHNTGYEPPSV